MTVIEIPDEQAAALKAKAAAQGYTLEVWLKKLSEVERADSPWRRLTGRNVRPWRAYRER